MSVFTEPAYFAPSLMHRFRDCDRIWSFWFPDLAPLTFQCFNTAGVSELRVAYRWYRLNLVQGVLPSISSEQRPNAKVKLVFVKSSLDTYGDF